MKIARYLYPYIKEDLSNKMIFIGGPRQVGKTTLALEFTQTDEQYLNWDLLEDRQKIKKHQISPDLKVVILDEIHKYTAWRSLIKGIFDKYRSRLRILVTGSARLDHFRKGGDSLVGRYHYYRLHPLTVSEVIKAKKFTIQDLLQFGGFPEPLTRRDSDYYRRWSRERESRVVYQDLRDLDTVKDLSKLEILVDMLKSKVGSQLSINSLKEDLEISPNTVSRWIEVLESVYFCYRVYPYNSPKYRAVKKTAKLYLWDWAQVESVGARFENFVASHLLKYCHFLEDTKGHSMELRYIRDTDLHEIDFLVIKDKKAIFAVECKTGEKSVSSGVRYFQKKNIAPKFYQVHLGSKEYIDDNIHVLPFEKFCEIEKLV